MALKATRLLRQALRLHAAGRTESALQLVREAGEHAAIQRQPRLLSDAATLWLHFGGDASVAERWRQTAENIRLLRASWR